MGHLADIIDRLVRPGASAQAQPSYRSSTPAMAATRSHTGSGTRGSFQEATSAEDDDHGCRGVDDRPAAEHKHGAGDGARRGRRHAADKNATTAASDASPEVRSGITVKR